MIELNLLPDVKLEYLKAQRSRRMAISISIIAAGAAIVMLVLILLANGIQKKHLSDLSQDIVSKSKSLQSQPDIDKILTVQNQLQSLTGLHAAKPAVSRLFGYLNSVTPSSVSINSLNLDFTQQTATITGNTDSLATVNKYVDTLKFTTFSDDSNPGTKAPAFSNVVLTGFALSADNKSKTASYVINLKYDPAIFNITKNVKLAVPQLTTTRASLESPTDLFQAAPPNTGTLPKGTQ
jgi:Tfp pilus assembly protein PilN